MDTDQASHEIAGSYTVTFKVALADYPSVTYTETFTVTIGACVITALNTNNDQTGELKDSTQTYNVASGQTNIGYDAFTFAPSVCTNYAVTYTANVNNAGSLDSLPAWIVLNTASGQIEVDTSTETHDGTYTIRLTGTMDDASTTSAFIEFTLVVVGCPSAVVTLGTGLET